MASLNKIKIGLIGIFSLIILGWSVSSATFTTHGDSPDSLLAVTESVAVTEPVAVANPDDYVGSETCQACHEDQFKEFSRTKHAKLKEVASWKNKTQGCESCHGPGKAHVEGEGDKTKISSFKNMNAKQASETCLACHTGKESHNNYRQGDHWRNNVGCNDCHTSHGPSHGKFKIGSATLVSSASDVNPAPAMLKANEQQLCIACHSEVKSHFSKPFRHKVMEGTMKCSDCHNAHGGYEAKQTKLAVGSEAACVRCHTDKQGPFVFEHAPLKVEGCAACHVSHGSANPRLLKRHQVRQLCLECHSGITEQLSDGPTGGPHDQKTLLQRNCTSCHSMIHGSNSSNVFFR